MIIGVRGSACETHLACDLTNRFINTNHVHQCTGFLHYKVPVTVLPSGPGQGSFNLVTPLDNWRAECLPSFLPSFLPPAIGQCCNSYFCENIYKSKGRSKFWPAFYRPKSGREARWSACHDIICVFHAFCQNVGNWRPVKAGQHFGR